MFKLFVLVQIGLFQFVATENVIPTSCSDWYHDGSTLNGHYTVVDKRGNLYKVFCDFESDESTIWTLVKSFSLANNPATEHFSEAPTGRNVDFEQGFLNYFIGLDHRAEIGLASTLFRATCQFEVDLQLATSRDYFIASFSDWSPFEYTRSGECLRVKEINIRGYNCRDCEEMFWQQIGTYHLHVGGYNGCGFEVSGNVAYEDNWGYYGVVNSAFRCSASQESTTNYWFGAPFPLIEDEPDVVTQAIGDLRTDMDEILADLNSQFSTFQTDLTETKHALLDTQQELQLKSAILDTLTSVLSLNTGTPSQCPSTTNDEDVDVTTK